MVTVVVASAIASDVASSKQSEDEEEMFLSHATIEAERLQEKLRQTSASLKSSEGRVHELIILLVDKDRLIRTLILALKAALLRTGRGTDFESGDCT